MIGDDAGAERPDRLAEGLTSEQQADGAAAQRGRGRVEHPGLQHGLTANRKKPSSETNSTNQPVPPANIMSKITTALIDMLETMIWRRPIVSERCPAIGAAMKPPACNANMQAPIHSGG